MKGVTLALLLTLSMAPFLASAREEGGLGINANINAGVSVNADRQGATTSTSTRDNDGDRDEDRGGDRQGIVGQIKAEVKSNMVFRAELVRANIKVAVEVFTATVNRLQKIVDRVESRMSKISAAGGATANAQAQVDMAKVKIADAKVKIAAIAALDFGSTTASTTLVGNFQTARADAKAIRDDLTLAKKSLMNAVEMMAKLQAGLHLNASTTASTTKDND